MKKDSRLFLIIPILIIAIFIAGNFQKSKPYPTVNTVNKNPGANELISIAPSSSRNIEILSPRTGDKVKSGFRIMGNARVFENLVSIRLLDSNGFILETNAIANAPDVGQYGSFEKVLNFQTNDSSGTLEVFQYSPKDGSEIDKVSVPVLFK